VGHLGINSGREIEAAVRSLGSADDLRLYAKRILRVSRLDEMGFPTGGRAAAAGD
jgi:hypothetical protein